VTYRLVYTRRAVKDAYSDKFYKLPAILAKNNLPPSVGAEEGLKILFREDKV
jgi:hypothetical protein